VRKLEASLRYILAAVLLAAATAPAQAQVWEKKEYLEWSAGDCRQILENSPWGTKFTLVEQRHEAFTVNPSRGTGLESSVRLDYIAQLRSALPIRQAVVRQLALDRKYDRMSDDDKRDFDQRAAQYLGMNFGKEIVIQIVLRTNVEIYQRQLVEYWLGVTESMVHETVYLINARGRRIAPIKYLRPSHGNPVIELVFPREHNCEPVVDGDDREFVVELPGYNLSARTAESRVLFTFKLQDLRYQGQLTF